MEAYVVSISRSFDLKYPAELFFLNKFFACLQLRDSDKDMLKQYSHRTQKYVCEIVGFYLLVIKIFLVA